MEKNSLQTRDEDIKHLWVAIAELAGRVNALQASVYPANEAENHCPSPLQPDLGHIDDAEPENNPLEQEHDGKTLRDLQIQVGEWSDRNFGEQDPINPLLGAMEELGELCHAVLKARQGIRGDVTEHRIAAADAIGDIIIYLADYCERNDHDFQECVWCAWDEVRARNWKRNKVDGK